jgi:hypothetical protein
MSEAVCPKCNNPNRVSARFCAICGAPMLAGVTEASPVPTDTVPLPSGTILQGRYRIEGLLGKGGFGAVYRTWDLSLSRLCAVKENLDVSPEAQRQFAREATVLAGLNHPNLPRVTDHFIIPGQGQYLVMDFVEGEDVTGLVNLYGIPPLEQTFEWLSQVMDALTYLHNRQPPVIHRDIKPANIRITPDGRAMLVDFGLVKASAPHIKTTLGARAVTPGYSPPEQYGQGHTDSRSDIYSLGATLYALLTGQDPPESVLRIGQEVIKPVEQINAAVSPAIGRVILHAMALHPAQRYQTVANLKSDLQAAQVAAPSATIMAGAPAPYVPTVIMSGATPPAQAVGVPFAGPAVSTGPQAFQPAVAGQTLLAGQPPIAGTSDRREQSTPGTPPAAWDGAPTGHRASPYSPASAPAKRSWLGIAVGIILVGIILAFAALAFIWNMIDQNAQEEMQRTVDAGVEATRTAWAQPTSGVFSPSDPSTTAQRAASTMVAADLMDFPSPLSADLYSNGVLYRTPTPESSTVIFTVHVP